MGRFTWVKCDGGPHVLLPSELEAIWSGTHAPSDRRVVKATFRWKPDPLTPASDYDAACDVDDLVGVISIAGRTAIVLGDEVPMSAWMHSELFQGGMIVVPMQWPGIGEFQDSILHALEKVSAEDFSETGLRIEVPSGKARLAPAADAGPNWDSQTQSISIPPGEYSVVSAEVRIDGCWLRLHGLRAAI